jgi:hypothetical protein
MANGEHDADSDDAFLVIIPKTMSELSKEVPPDLLAR